MLARESRGSENQPDVKRLGGNRRWDDMKVVDLHAHMFEFPVSVVADQCRGEALPRAGPHHCHRPLYRTAEASGLAVDVTNRSRARGPAVGPTRRCVRVPIEGRSGAANQGRGSGRG